MAGASEVISGGFRLRSEAKAVRWPDRYMDDRGRELRGRVLARLPDGLREEAEAVELLRAGIGGSPAGPVWS